MWMWMGADKYVRGNGKSLERCEHAKSRCCPSTKANREGPLWGAGIDPSSPAFFSKWRKKSRVLVANARTREPLFVANLIWGDNP
jgi:hypothetical protein